MSKPEFLHMPLDRLEPNPWNTNFVSPENQAKLAAAIARFGFFKPLIVRETGDTFEILGGEHRWRAARDAGLAEVPVMNLGVISDREAREISLADNARYGADDTLALAELLREIGKPEDLQVFLPFTDTELASIISSTSIAIDDLELPDGFEESGGIELPEERPARPPKTHTIMRFKVSLEDAERLTALIAETQKDHGFTGSDQLTNAGDALVHLLLSGTGS